MNSAADLQAQNADNSLVKEFRGEQRVNYTVGIFVALFAIGGAVGSFYFFGSMVTFG